MWCITIPLFHLEKSIRPIYYNDFKNDRMLYTKSNVCIIFRWGSKSPISVPSFHASNFDHAPKVYFLKWKSDDPGEWY